jgi:hypothetical protein
MVKSIFEKKVELTHTKCQKLFRGYTFGELSHKEKVRLQSHLANCQACLVAYGTFVETEIDAGHISLLQAPSHLYLNHN